MVVRHVQQHNFSIVPQAHIPRSSFNRSFGLKTTFDSGYLIPFFCDEVIPGDTINLTASCFVRLASPLQYPIFDNMYFETFYFFVPNRLIWEHWQNFMGEQVNPTDSIDYLIPQITPNKSTGFESFSLADYFGLPINIPDLSVNALWHRAYFKIYQDWFKDENLVSIDTDVLYTGDTTKTDAKYGLVRRGKRHDYFTSCLPFPQKGPAVEIPLGTTAPVVGNGNALGLSVKYNNAIINDSYALINTAVSSSVSNNVLKVAGNFSGQSAGTTISASSTSGNGTNQVVGVSTDSTYSGLIADLSSATAATINSLRQAFAYQSLFEAFARGGSRYIEIIRSCFGVVSPDGRLQRAEYLGGSSDMLRTDTVVQTSQTSSDSTLGDLGAYAYSSNVKHGFTRSFSEHGVIIGLCNVRADLTYQQGIPRMFSRRERFDFYFPQLAHLGEQAVLNKEIYAQGTSADEQVFGYQERWAEYRYKPSQITGMFRSTYPQSLDAWHLSQKFDSLPTLNQTFIEENPPIDRVVAVTDLPQFIMDAYFKQIHVRPMPTYSVPGIGTRF